MTTKSTAVPKGGLFICRPAPVIYHNGFIQGFSLLSDLHIGARNVDYSIIMEELENAKKSNDRILLNGDIFDMILIADRKRFRADVLHPRLVGKVDIINAAIEWGVEILGPYADLIDMVGCGNHETSIEKYHNIDVLKILVHELRKLRKDKNHTIHFGGYTGFVDYRFRMNDKEGVGHGNGKRFVIYYHHGSGGSAPITKGMIDFARKGWVQADVIWMGHKHNRLASAIQTYACPLQGYDPVVKDVRQIMSGAYFRTYDGQTQESYEEHGRIASWAADIGFAPQGVGGARIELVFGSQNDPYRVRVIQ